MILIIEDILRRMQKLSKPELKEKFSQRGLKNVEFGLTDRDLEDLAKEMGPQPLFILEKLWETGFYECKWLALLSVQPKHLDRSLVERWGQELEDRSQAKVFAQKIFEMSFIPRRLRNWLTNREHTLSWLAEEWLWTRMREAEGSPQIRKELTRITPRILKILDETLPEPENHPLRLRLVRFIRPPGGG